MKREVHFTIKGIPQTFKEIIECATDADVKKTVQLLVNEQLSPINGKSPVVENIFLVIDLPS